MQQQLHASQKILVSMLALVLLFAASVSAQVDSTYIPPKKGYFLAPSPHFNKARFAAVLGTDAAVYGSTLVGLNYLWYAGYPRSKFHFFNDAGEWNQIDKCGHAFTANFESNWMCNLYLWSGMKPKKAAIYGSLSGFLMQSSIEVLDGFSAKWGASVSDLGANFFGSSMFLWQQLLWKEQRIQMKINMTSFNYPNGVLLDRANNLYGSSFIEKTMKDYNELNYWLCINPASFNPHQKHARWMSIAIGYGAGNMYGGYSNVWTDKNGKQIDRTDQKRYRRFFLSFDADFTKIHAKTRVGKAFLGMMNTIKLPAPALEVNTLGQVIFHPCFFMNWEVPLYLKR
jgi:hypothetical protein